jgi:TolA-binding protein
MNKLVAVLLLLLITTACVDTTKIETDLTDIKTQMWRLQKEQAEQTEAVKQLNEKLDVEDENTKQSADFVVAVDEINANINILFERVKDLNEKMMMILSKLSTETPASNSVDKQEAGEGQNIVKQPMVSKNQMFSIAYTDFISEKYNVSILGFEDFIKNNPDSDKVDNAYYYLGLCYFNLEKYRDSIKAFDKIINDYPDSDVRVSAMLRKALSLLEISLPRGSVELKNLIKEYPTSQEARIARQKLDELNIPHQ